MIETPLLVLTGAGISAESGVPTFRGRDGLWKNYRPEELATPEAFQRNPETVWEWYGWRRERVADCRPNDAHEVLVEIERFLVGTRDDEVSVSDAANSKFLLVTQNVDGLHELAGSRTLLRLHGSIWRVRCTNEGTRSIDRRVPLPSTLPRCKTCDAGLRPDVVWFGESLDSDILDAAFLAASTARTVLSIGTSSLVQPAASLPLIAKQNGARLIEINPTPTPLTPSVREHIAGPAGTELRKWWNAVRT